MRINFVHSCIRDLDSNHCLILSGGERPSRLECIYLINYVILCSIFNTTTCSKGQRLKFFQGGDNKGPGYKARPSTKKYHEVLMIS